MEYIFALFPLLFFSSPPFFPPPLLSLVAASLVSRPLSAALNARSARNENEPQKSFVRASVTFDIRAFFYTTSRFSCEDFTVLEKETPGVSFLSHQHRPSDVCRLNSFFFHFLLLSSIFSFISFSSFFPFVFVFYFPFFFFFRRSVPFSRSLCARAFFPSFFLWFLFVSCLLLACRSMYIFSALNRKFTESEIVINVPCNEHLSRQEYLEFGSISIAKEISWINGAWEIFNLFNHAYYRSVKIQYRIEGLYNSSQTVQLDKKNHHQIVLQQYTKTANTHWKHSNKTTHLNCL